MLSTSQSQFMYLLLQYFQNIQNDETHTERKELAASKVYNVFTVLGTDCCNFFPTRKTYSQKRELFFFFRLLIWRCKQLEIGRTINTLSNKRTSWYNTLDTHELFTCFDTGVPSSGSYYNKVVQANLPIYALFVLINIIKTLDLQYIKLFKQIKLSVMIVHSVQMCYNTLI